MAEARQKVGFVIDADIWRRFKILCVGRGRSLSHVLEELVRQYVQHEEDQP